MKTIADFHEQVVDYTRRKEIAEYMFDKSQRTSFLKLSVPYEDTTIRPNSTQRMM